MNAIASTQRANRRTLVARLLAHTPDALVVTGLGSASYDVFASGDNDRYYYLWGAMGGAVPLGLGLALAQPARPVIVITGDGEQLMGIGSLATVGAQQPANLTIVVLDNGHFGETGMQRSHASLGTDLVAVARGFGLQDARRIQADTECDGIAQHAQSRAGLLFVQAMIDADEPPRALPPRDGPYIKNRLRTTLGLQPI